MPSAAELFVQPTLTELSTTRPAAEDGEVFAGILTLGNMSGHSRSLRGRVYRLGDQLLVVGEHELGELEQLTSTVLQLNDELADTQRELVRQNRALRRQEEHIQALLRTDPLTGVGNRRLLDERLAEELVRCERTGNALALVMADIDHFKRINDTAGHATGDRVLQHFAVQLRTGTRSYDTVARFGGEEFVLLLPQTPVDAAVQLVERIGPVLQPGQLTGIDHRVTASYGATGWHPGDRPDDLLHRADLALYEAKASGRNRVSRL